MVIRMRHTRAHTKNRRSHHAIKATNLAVCEHCNEPKVRHRVCANCGTYRKRPVLDVVKQAITKQNSKPQVPKNK